MANFLYNLWHRFNGFARSECQMYCYVQKEHSSMKMSGSLDRVHISLHHQYHLVV